MQSTEMIRYALEFTRAGMNRLIEDVNTPARQSAAPQPGGNHPHWIMGHLCAVEGAIQASIAGEPNRHERLWAQFGPGTRPAADVSGYPAFDELVRTFNAIRAETLKLLERVGEAGLERRPAVIPEGFEEAMSTNAKTFMLIPLHQMVHYGQMTDCRRAAGLKPLM